MHRPTERRFHPLGDLGACIVQWQKRPGRLIGSSARILAPKAAIEPRGPILSGPLAPLSRAGACYGRRCWGWARLLLRSGLMISTGPENLPIPALAIEHVAHLDAVYCHPGRKGGPDGRGTQSAIDVEHDRGKHSPAAIGVPGKGRAGHRHILCEARVGT